MTGEELETVLRQMADDYDLREPREGGRLFIEEVTRRLRAAPPAERATVLATLLDLVEKQDPSLANAALQVLIDEGGATVGQRLLHMFEASQDDRVRDELALALARLRYAEACDAIRRHILSGLFDENDRSHRATTLAFAIRLGDDDLMETAARFFVWLLGSPRLSYQVANLTPLYVRQLTSEGIARLRQFVGLVCSADRAAGARLVASIAEYAGRDFAKDALDEETRTALRAHVGRWCRAVD